MGGSIPGRCSLGRERLLRFFGLDQPRFFCLGNSSRCLDNTVVVTCRFTLEKIVEKAHGGLDQESSAVTRRISSNVVMPSRALSMPTIRKVFIPSATAWFLIT